MKTQTQKTNVKVSLNDKQTLLKNKENKSTFDYCKLANVTDKIENKTASKVYKNCISNPEIKKILGTNKVPTFAEFLTKLPVKDSYSNWIGYLTLAKFNTKNELKKKIDRQNKIEAKK